MIANTLSALRRSNLLATCLVLLSVTAIPFLAGCGDKSPATAQASTATDFPDSTIVPGWSRAAEIRTFSSAELSRYIDGDAEKYSKVGVLSTSTADYKFQDKFEAVADIYSFHDPSGAKAIFDSEPAGDTAAARIGDAARLYEQSLIFYRGRYLVRIVAYQASPEMQQALLDLGKAIDSKLGQ